jgi:predicted nucleic acid-binding protein
MTPVFVDSSFWIARLAQHDERHRIAVATSREFEPSRLVTTAFVLAEVLNAFSSRGPLQRRAAADFANRVRRDNAVRCIEVDSELLSPGIALYRNRPDKYWSLTDCVSFAVMTEMKIAEALTFDGDFTQAGFVALPRTR